MLRLFKLLILGVIAQCMVSCSSSNDVVSHNPIQKRKHRQGFHVDFGHQQAHKNKTFNHHNEKMDRMASKQPHQHVRELYADKQLFNFGLKSSKWLAKEPEPKSPSPSTETVRNQNTLSPRALKSIHRKIERIEQRATAQAWQDNPSVQPKHPRIKELTQKAFGANSSADEESDAMAIVALALGALGLLLVVVGLFLPLIGLVLLVVGLLFSIAAIVLGAIGSGPLARVGMILGIVAVAIFVLILLLIIALILAFL